MRRDNSGTYLALAVLGAIAPLVLFTIFFAQEGFDLGELVDQVFGTPIAAAVMADLTASSVVFWVWLFREAPRIGVKPLPYVAANLFVGLCFALPLFLYAREKRALSASGGGVASYAASGGAAGAS
jgi:hypothetical protein